MDAECKAIEKKMQSEVDQFKSLQKGKRQINKMNVLNVQEVCIVTIFIHGETFESVLIC